ncbi:hypothetical protein GZH47_11925 [Paenibacillus rhizovicinus]|uniref:OmpR/PhoB-type domain-containing protein n=2 Tax=Paenibacillus rhizovicinus TaxID=2704463 RepID=A0A6C0PBJ2_9BACL|nr:hypothetical protein GZH47_11925 [Paenibacillus rhizovicinus]
MPYGEEQAGVDGSASAGEAGLNAPGAAAAVDAQAAAGPGAETVTPERTGLSPHASEGAAGWQAGHAGNSVEAAGQAAPNAASADVGTGAGVGAYAAERAGNGGAPANTGRDAGGSHGLQPDRPDGVPSGAAANAAGLDTAANAGQGAGSSGLPGSAAAAGRHDGNPGQPDAGASCTSDTLAVPQIGGAASPDAGGAQPSFDRAVARPYHRPARAGDIDSGPFLLSAAERRLWKDGVEIVLTPTEWTLMKLLMEREGEGLSRDDILNAVWGRHYVGDLKIVDVNIRRIRQKIEIKPSDPKHIETLWGYGYRWNRSGGL